MTAYVCGFAFSGDDATVWLIQKQRPDWQKGLLNGIGGHIEPGEAPEKAMEREFYEEAGIVLSDWKCFAIIRGNEADGEPWEVQFYWTEIPEGMKPEAKTDEPLQEVAIFELQDAHTVPNVQWLIPMALNNRYGAAGQGTAAFYEVREDSFR